MGAARFEESEEKVGEGVKKPEPVNTEIRKAKCERGIENGIGRGRDGG